jgi:hypothetical protein
MINVYDIMILLGVTEQQVAIAIYSGRIPKPNDEGGWTEEHIVPFLNNWEASILKVKGTNRSLRTIESNGMTFPSHQR